MTDDGGGGGNYVNGGGGGGSGGGGVSDGLVVVVVVMVIVGRYVMLRGEEKKALIIQLEMEKKGNCFKFGHLNHNHGRGHKSNQIEEAGGLFAEMKSKGIQPISSLYELDKHNKSVN
uniref:Pentatricopeptide repeat-containing protein n=1 Tax=Lactuca sativa TaxID=4236 RepID=A0A9R1UV14_LACSA|nr:hypothetical protein LSAT_V11C800414120 [Lactuca sativa]